MSEPALKWSVNGPIAEIVLNRPERYNCWNGEMYDLLGDAVSAIEEDGGVRCVTVTGAGGNFSSGGDLRWYAERRAEAHARGEHFQYAYPSYRAFGALRMPVIAAIDGQCLMAGLNFATFFCDIRIASERARFHFAIPRNGGQEIGGLGNRGLYPTPYTWHMSLGDVLYLSAAGGEFDAVRAMQAGLLQEVVPHESLASRAREIAERVADLPPDRIRGAKELYKRYLRESHAPIDELAEIVERPTVSLEATERYLEQVRRFTSPGESLEKKKL